jgi:hypothetical protein
MALLLSNRSEAERLRDPGAGFVQQKHPKVGKDYYVVRQGKSDKCLAALRMQLKAMQALRSKNFPNARAASRTSP